jgi:ABC-type lipoprotein release transport system permease subunit
MSIALKMAWRNVWRNRRRSILTMAAIAFACTLLIFMLSFQFGTYETMINSAVRIHTGYFQVQAEGYHDDPSVRKVVAEPERVAHVLSETPQVTAFAPRAAGFALISSETRTYGAMVNGVDPEREPTVSRIPKLVRQGRFLEPGDEDAALVGELLAKNLQVGLGDSVTLLGQGRDGSIAAAVVTVRGIFHSGQDEFDRSALYLPLDYFQEVFFMRGAVHKLVAVTDSLGNVPEAERAVRDALADPSGLVVLDWDELMPGLSQSILIDLISGLIFYGLLLVVVAFSILNTFLMAVLERTREFGVMMALGTSRNRLTRLLLTESMLLTGVGIGLGVSLGCVVTLFFQFHGIEMSEAAELLQQFGISGTLYPRLSWLSAAIGPVLVLFITFLTAVYPALRVRRLTPVEAMRHV